MSILPQSILIMPLVVVAVWKVMDSEGLSHYRGAQRSIIVALIAWLQRREGKCFMAWGKIFWNIRRLNRVWVKIIDVVIISTFIKLD